MSRTPFKRTQRFQLAIDLFTEGKKTEPQYLRDFIRQQGKKDKIYLNHLIYETDTVKLVQQAISYTTTIKKDDVPRETWVVFDFDEHEDKVIQGLKLLERHNASHPNKQIKLAFMKPCFEIWPLIHFKQTDLPNKTQQVQEKLSSLMSQYNHHTKPIINIDECSEDGYLKALKLARSWDISGDSDILKRTFVAGIYQLTEIIREV